MAGSNSSSAITLETTPTWAVAVVCFILITISILIEHALHLLAKVCLNTSISPNKVNSIGPLIPKPKKKETQCAKLLTCMVLGKD